MKFLASTAIFLFAQLPVMLLSFVIVPFMLLTKWDGRTTWLGNFKWGRGEAHYKYPADTFWRQWWFLCIRNPVSNFGKHVLAVDDKPGVWLYDVQVYKALNWKWGWKLPSGEMPTRRTFIYRPYFKRGT